MPFSSTSNAGRNVSPGSLSNLCSKKTNKRTLDISKEQEKASGNVPKKKFVTITDSEENTILEDRFNKKSLPDAMPHPDKLINGKDADKSSLKVTIRRMSQNAHVNSVSENFGLLNHQYQCQNPPSEEFSRMKDVSVSTTNSATFTEPDLLGPCEPGTKIVLDATVWLESPGMLIVNANWRGKCYLGTLIDASKSSLGPNCPDKSISALSFMRNRAWRGSISKNRGFPKNMNRFSHLQRDLFENSNNAGITTRSAKAAAMAAANKNQDSQGLSSESEMSTSSSVTASNKRPPEDNEGKLGQKRRSKRSRNTKEPSSNIEERKGETNNNCLVKKPKPPSDQLIIKNEVEETPIEEQVLKPIFPCPHSDCNKEFPSQISLRFHLQLGHTRVKKDINTKLRKEERKKKSKKLKEYEFDENDAPPQLQEEIPIEEPKDLAIFDNKPSAKIEQETNLTFENKTDYIPPMPTASPAYSDISDDDLQDTTLKENGNCKKSCNANDSNIMSNSEIDIELPNSKQQYSSIANFPKHLTSLGQFSKLHLENPISNQQNSDKKFLAEHSNSVPQFTFDTINQNNSSQ